MVKNHSQEEKALKLSIGALILFSLMGIVFGLLLSSEVIFFDGIFSLFSVAIGFVTLRVSRFIRKKDHFNFPFGKEAIEPVVVVIQYLILSAFLMYALYDAIQMIASGGSETQLGSVILYLAITTAILFFVVRKMKTIAEKAHSTIIDAEFVQWKVTLNQSFFALGGYLVSLLLVAFSFNNILPYIDPGVLIIFIILTFITVIKEMLAAFKEVIGMRNISNQLQQEIEGKVKDIVAIYQIKDYYLRVNKVGSTMVVEVDFLVDKEFKFGSVHQQDEIREAFEKSLANIEYELWLSIAFTTQYKWIV